MNNEQIQGNLHALNYSPGILDGDPTGPLGVAAVKLAQTGYGITVDGIAGPITQEYLSGQLSVLQQKLKDKGYYLGEIDGIWGPMTNDAIKRFQTDKGLIPDGIIGEQTLGALFDDSTGSSESILPEAENQENYFGPDEFKCECGCGRDVCQELKDLANKIRRAYKHPLVVSSGFRCPTQNAKDGGAPDSLHMEGIAFDTYSPGRMTREEVDVIANIVRECGGGCILYHDQLFVHVELTDAFWSMN